MAIAVAPRTGEECLTHGPRPRIMCGPGPTEANDKLEYFSDFTKATNMPTILNH